MGGSVKTAFGGVSAQLDKIGANLAKVKKASSEITRLQQAQGRLSQAQGKGNAEAVRRHQEQVDKLTASLRAAGVNTSRLTHEQARLNSELARGQSRMSGFANLRSGMSSFGSAISGVRDQVSGLITKMTLLGVAGGYAFKTQFIDTAAAFEKYRIQLKAFGDDAEKALSWSEQFAMQTPLNLDQVVKAYVRLRQQGLDPTDGTLQALTDSVAKVGGEFYDLEEIINQLGQAFRKEKLTAEDVKPLINRGIPVYEMLSKALGKSAKEIMKMQEKGELGKDAIKGLLFELGRWSKGMSAEMAGTWSGILGRMGDYWVKFTKTVMESGPFKVLKNQLEGFLSRLEDMDKDGTLKRWAEETGAEMVKVMQSMREFAIDTWKAVTAVKEFVGGWRNLGIIVGVVAFAPTIASVVQLGLAIGGVAKAIATLTFGPLFASLGALTGLTWAAAGPWLLLAGAIGLAAAALYNNWGGIGDWFKSNVYEPIASQINGLIDKLKELWDWISKTSVGKFFSSTPAMSLTPEENTMAGIPMGSGDPYQQLMPAEKMPGTTNNNNVTNQISIKVDAPNTNGSAIADGIWQQLKSKPLFDQTSVLAPQ